MYPCIKFTFYLFVISHCFYIGTVSSKNAFDIIKEADKDGDGKLNQAESIDYISKIIPNKLSNEAIKGEINSLDKNHDGFLTAEEIDPPSATTPKPYTSSSKDVQVQDIIKDADKDKDGKLNQAESVDYISKITPFRLSNEAIKAEVNSLDKNHDGFLTAEEIDPPTTTAPKPKSSSK